MSSERQVSADGLTGDDVVGEGQMSRPSYIERYWLLSRLVEAAEQNSDAVAAKLLKRERRILGDCWCLVDLRLGPLGGTLCSTMEQARILRDDRRANGDASGHETPMQVWVVAIPVPRCLTEGGTLR